LGLREKFSELEEINSKLDRREYKEAIYAVLFKMSKKMRIRSSTTLRNTKRAMHQKKGGAHYGLIRAAVWEQACGLLEKEMESYQ
jgi:hypothetical protein